MNQLVCFENRKWIQLVFSTDEDVLLKEPSLFMYPAQGLTNSNTSEHQYCVCLVHLENGLL